MAHDDASSMQSRRTEAGSWHAFPVGVLAAAAGAGAVVALVIAVALFRAPPPELSGSAGTSGPGPAVASVPAAAADAAAVGPVHATTNAAPTADALPAPADPRAHEIWSALLAHVRAGRYEAASLSLGQLVDVDPSAHRDGSVRAAAVDLAVRLELSGAGAADQVFDLLAKRFGHTGADVLYELVTTRGGSRASVRAARLLADPAVRDGGTAALRIAYDLRSAKRCDEKIALLDRAARDGDFRALGLLQEWNRPCRRAAECCLHNDDRLKSATRAIRDRSEPSQAR